MKDTTLGEAIVGTQVNLEVDLLARYMERLMQGDSAAFIQGGITEDLLHKSGFFG
jgi:riboflavin synthase